MSSTAEAPSRDNMEHFQAIPWCAKQLNCANVVASPAISRHVKEGLEDSLFATTLNSVDTIAAFVTFYTHPGDDSSLVNELGAFITLGSLVNGFPGVCHGGIVMTIMDEVMGLLVPLNKERGAIGNSWLMTAYLNSTFIRPITTPSTIRVTARFTKTDGRKYYCESTIEDENAVVLARAEALFVALRDKL